MSSGARERKAPTRYQQGIVTAGALQARDREAITSARIQDRILEAVDEDDKYWNCPPGVLPWHVARQALGGGVRTKRFQAEVDQLIADGRVVEVWLRPSICDTGATCSSHPGVECC